MRTLTISDPGLLSGRPSYGTKVLSLGPVAYWPMQDTSGTTMTALSGSNGTYSNGPTLAVAGPSLRIPNAVSFDGINNYASAACRAWVGLAATRVAGQRQRFASGGQAWQTRRSSPVVAAAPGRASRGAAGGAGGAGNGTVPTANRGGGGGVNRAGATGVVIIRYPI